MKVLVAEKIADSGIELLKKEFDSAFESSIEIARFAGD